MPRPNYDHMTYSYLTVSLPESPAEWNETLNVFGSEGWKLSNMVVVSRTLPSKEVEDTMLAIMTRSDDWTPLPKKEP